MGALISNMVNQTHKILIAVLFVIGFSSASEWTQWKLHNNFTFNNFEEKSRYNHFVRSKYHVEQHNRRYDQGLETFYLSLNKFAAMSNEEFRLKYTFEQNLTLGGVPETQQAPGGNLYHCAPYTKTGTNFPASVDYSNYVTSVKSQGSCGSCYAFSAAAAMEGALCKAGRFNCKSWDGVSAQQIVDCSMNNPAITPYEQKVGYGGCNGGQQPNSFNYVHVTGGIMSWNDYPYKGKVQQCAYQSNRAVTSISGCTELKDGWDANILAWDENLLQNMIAEKGITTGNLDAGSSDFQFYSGGVFNSKDCHQGSGPGSGTAHINHAIAIVGYGNKNGVDYYKIKNSWGSNWGDHGFMLIERGKNMCGIAQWA